MTPRRIEVKIGALVVEDPAFACREIAAGLERELGRSLVCGGVARTSARTDRAASSRLAQDGLTASLSAAIAQLVPPKLLR